jgi:hypothetical protein
MADINTVLSVITLHVNDIWKAETGIWITTHDAVYKRHTKDSKTHRC